MPLRFSRLRQRLLTHQQHQQKAPRHLQLHTSHWLSPVAVAMHQAMQRCRYAILLHPSLLCAIQNKCAMPGARQSSATERPDRGGLLQAAGLLGMSNAIQIMHECDCWCHSHVVESLKNHVLIVCRWIPWSITCRHEPRTACERMQLVILLQWSSSSTCCTPAGVFASCGVNDVARLIVGPDKRIVSLDPRKREECIQRMSCCIAFYTK